MLYCLVLSELTSTVPERGEVQMPKNNSAKLVKVGINFLGISAEWEADPTERKAAWELYVELITRISTQPLSPDQGLLREALFSLHALFETTRQILRNAGPDVGASQESVGGIAIAVLNQRLRPFLAQWHPELTDYESTRQSNVGQRQHEQAWQKSSELRQELEQLRKDLDEYANALAEIAGVK